MTKTSCKEYKEASANPQIKMVLIIYKLYLYIGIRWELNQLWDLRTCFANGGAVMPGRRARYWQVRVQCRDPKTGQQKVQLVLQRRSTLPKWLFNLSMPYARLPQPNFAIPQILYLKEGIVYEIFSGCKYWNRKSLRCIINALQSGSCKFFLYN